LAKLPYASVISDALYPDNLEYAHPRLYSAFSKILRDYVRERKIFTIQEAVKKMTSMPAKRMEIKKRGLIKEGFYADINIFNLENVKDNADFNKSGVLAEGMDYVFINGKTAWDSDSINRIINYNGVFIEK
jgi:N-acyl-D-aspartate/D-glutamate deacylase